MSKNFEFHKYHGTGNDFILIDSFNTDIKLTGDTIKQMCHRQFGIGADGLMILRKKPNYDFYMEFYNSDGNPGSMCGNGGRCIVAFAHDLGIINNETTFWAPDGEHQAVFHSHDKISLKMKDVTQYESHKLGIFMDTGSPHLVIFRNNESGINVYNEGKTIRYSETYKKDGVNVNFVIPANDVSKIFTYERGVENQTFSCGTGTVASALTLNLLKGNVSPVQFESLGGHLAVYFDKKNENTYTNIWLEGPAINVFKGFYQL